MMELVYTMGAAVIAALVYLNSLDGEFVFDDNQILHTVQYHASKRSGGRLRDLWNHERFWTRPALFWTYTRDMLRHGIQVRGWHATNLAIHAVNSSLVYAILRNWFDAHPAFIGACLFAAYPLGTSAVASISGRSSALATLFVFGAMIALLASFWMLAILFLLAGYRVREDTVLFLPSLGLIWWYR